ncbi:hypothetical protein AZA_63685 [Nitrospirillum viridazoti Y2]|nr:hypothetical protein AZA_63685 [Nitrospirillum amazonense Y2]
MERLPDSRGRFPSADFTGTMTQQHPMGCRVLPAKATWQKVRLLQPTGLDRRIRPG